jgi:hypothetical protein
VVAAAVVVAVAVEAEVDLGIKISDAAAAVVAATVAILITMEVDIPKVAQWLAMAVTPGVVKVPTCTLLAPTMVVVVVDHGTHFSLLASGRSLG